MKIRTPMIVLVIMCAGFVLMEIDGHIFPGLGTGHYSYPFFDYITPGFDPLNRATEILRADEQETSRASYERGRAHLRARDFRFQPDHFPEAGFVEGLSRTRHGPVGQ